MKFTIDLDLKFNNTPKEEILTIVEEAVINEARNQHIKLLNLCKTLELNNPSIESNQLIEHHMTWIELLEKAKIDCEEI